MAEKEDVKEHLVPSGTEAGTEPQPVLPRDVFSNGFTYFLYFFIQNPLVWIPLVLFGTFLFFAVTTGSKLLVCFSLVTGCLVPIISFVVFINYMQAEVSSNFELEQSMQFLFEIRDVKPGMRTVKWDIVANRMNNHLFETKCYSHKYAFYDGRHCSRQFKRWYLLPREEAFDAAPLGDSAHGGNSAYSYFKRQVSKEYYESVDEQVTEMCEERFESRCAEV